MATNDRTVIAFDLYGTLLSTESIAQQLTTHFGPEKASEVATVWRRYQLEYTWRLNSMSTASFKHGCDPYIFIPFTTVTSNALTHALRVFSLSISSEASSSLMRSYTTLDAFPDVRDALSGLAGDSSIHPVIFTNGTHAAVTETLRSSSLSSHAALFKEVVTVDGVQKYKPAREVYYHLAEVVGKGEKTMGEMWLVSANPFDIVGAMAVGMRTAWVDREGGGWVDSLMGVQPDLIASELIEVVEGIKKLA